MSELDKIHFDKTFAYHYVMVNTNNEDRPVIIMPTIRKILQTSVVAPKHDLNLYKVPNLAELVETGVIVQEIADRMLAFITKSIKTLENETFYVYYTGIDNNLGMMMHLSEMPKANYNVINAFTWLNINFNVLSKEVGEKIKK